MLENIKEALKSVFQSRMFVLVVVFGILLGVLTGLFRIFGGSAEGVSYAIIISNILVPLIEKVTLPKAFGKEGK